MISTTRLDTLPVELITAIGVKADYHDLFSLRGVCRAVHAAVDDRFIKTYFVRRSHIYESRSVQVLLQISRVERLAETIKHVHLAAFSLRKPNMNSPTYVQELRNFESVEQDKVAMKMDGQAVQSLTEILSNLSAHGQLSTLSVSDRVYTNTYKGNRSFEGTLLPSNFAPADCHDAIASLFKAAASTNAAPHVLDLCHTSRVQGFDMQALEMDKATKDFLATFWPRLRNLSIGDVGKVIDLTTRRLSFLSQMDEFRTLSVNSFHSPIAFFPLRDLSRWINAPNLHLIELKYMNIDAQDLQRLVLKFRESLQGLRLTHICLHDGEKWEPLFDILSTFPILHDVVFHQLRREFYVIPHVEHNCGHVLTDFMKHMADDLRRRDRESSEEEADDDDDDDQGDSENENDNDTEDDNDDDDDEFSDAGTGGGEEEGI